MGLRLRELLRGPSHDASSGGWTGGCVGVLGEGARGCSVSVGGNGSSDSSIVSGGGSPAAESGVLACAIEEGSTHSGTGVPA